MVAVFHFLRKNFTFLSRSTAIWIHFLHEQILGDLLCVNIFLFRHDGAHLTLHSIKIVGELPVRRDLVFASAIFSE